ncbi:MAG: hypothetical protein JXR70_06525 [Spirochaetales bacterium]|nr:hypothetical protein [Spirochaetales bacterium]
MSDDNFLETYEETVTKKQEHVELKTLPKLKEAISIFQTYFQNLYNILIRKSLIQEDPYKYDEKISEVSAPSSEPILDSEKQEQISRRISSYHSQLEFLNNFYQFSLSFLNLGRLKKIVALMKYINWISFSPSSTHSFTRYFAELVHKIKMGTDPVSTQIVVDSVNQIEKNMKNIFLYIDEVITIQKEAYKLDVRKNLIPNLGLKRDKVTGNFTEVTKLIKKSFPKYINDQPFFAELIQEILEEDFTANGQELRNAIINKLDIKEAQNKTKKKENSSKTILLQGVRILASAGFQMEDAVNKLSENNTAYVNRKMTVGERFKRWVRKVVTGGKDDTHSYDIDYFDVTSSSSRTEKVNWDSFIQEVQKKGKLYSALCNKASSTFNRLYQAQEDKIYEFLTKNIAELHLVHRRMVGLNDFFKTETPKDKRGKIRAINIELEAMKNSIIKANKKKHEYVAAKEEMEQMKRLGIKTTAEDN